MVSVSDFEPGDRIKIRWDSSYRFAEIIDPSKPRNRYACITPNEVCFRVEDVDYNLEKTPHNCHSITVERLSNGVWAWDGVIHKAIKEYDPAQQPFEDSDI
jgi:hypothetical protein